MCMDEYEVIPSEKVAVSKVLSDMWIHLGRPQNPFSSQGQKLMDLIIATWEDLNPREAREWYALRADYQEHELSIHEQVKGETGRSLASYPMYIYQICKKLFPGFDMAEKENTKKIVKLWPMFRFANKI